MTNDEIYEDFIEHILQGKVEQLPDIYDNFLPLLEQYATFRGFYIDELKALFALALAQDAQIYNNESFIEYKIKYQEILEKQKAEYDKKPIKYKENNPFVPTQTEIEFMRQKECDKFLYFCYCIDSTPIIIKSPSENKEQKKFLGYEWSSIKGQEGIQYINSTSITDIQTTLYNPKNQYDSTKLNYYILQNFYTHFKATQSTSLDYYENQFSHNSNIAEIPQELQQYAFKARLVDMLDFSRAEFSKAISLSPVTSSLQTSGASVAIQNPFADSKFELVKVAECGDFIGGLWKGKKPPFIKVKVIRNTNFSMGGNLKLDSEYPELQVETSQFDKRKLEYGDIIIEKSGGSNTQAVGRVVIFNLKTDELYSFSNFTTRLKVTRNDLNPFYLHLVLNFIYQQGLTFAMQSGMSGIRNLDFNQYKNIKIPLPPLEIQKQIVAECEKVEKQYQTIRMSIDEYKKLIEAILIKCGVCERERERESDSAQNIDYFIESLLSQIAKLESRLDLSSLRGSLSEAKTTKQPTKSNGLPRVSSKTLAMTELLQSLPMPPKQGWDKIKLGKVAFYPKDKITVDLLTAKNYVGVDNLLQNKQGKIDAEFVLDKGSANAYHKNDILLSNIRPYLKKIWLADIDGGTNGDVVVLRCRDIKRLHYKFLHLILSDDKFFEYEMQNVKGLKMPRADKNAILNYTFALPPLHEQEKIIACVENLEAQISHLNSILPTLESEKTRIIEKYLFQTL